MAELPLRAVRLARPTADLDAMVAFYHDALGLPVIGRFAGHAGYDGVMFGLPGGHPHLEFTTSPGAAAAAPPSREHLLVLYLASRDDVRATAARLTAAGYALRPPENPYWRDAGAIEIADPDGWGVLLALDA